MKSLPLERLISLNLRLGQRLVLTHDKRQASIGLSIHFDTKHRCSKTEHYKIDFVKENQTPETHPECYIKGCPASYYDPFLFRQICQAIEIEDLGGLAVFAGSVGVAHLPWRCVNFYQEVLNARDRFLRERDSVQARLISGK